MRVIKARERRQGIKTGSLQEGGDLQGGRTRASFKN
jgi:hypothetical protein